MPNTIVPQLTLSDRAALLGIATPLSDIAIAVQPAGEALAIISARLGKLSADTTPGITVHGNGSTSLWLSGTVAQINAKLATLTYVGGSPGTDQVTLTLLDAQGEITTSHAPLAVVPLVENDLNDAVVTIDQGTLTLDTRVVDGPAIALREPLASQNATTCILINTTIGAQSTLSIRNENGGGGVAPRLAIAGRVELDATTSFDGNGTNISLAQGATLLNEGSMTIGAGAAQFSGSGTLVNNGTITLVGAGAAAAVSVNVDPAVSGTGRIALTAGASLSLHAAVAASETVLLADGANTLHLTNAKAFAGVIADFSHLDTIVLDGASASAGIYSVATDAETGTLTLVDGQQVVARLHFSAPEAGTVFQLGTDAAGDTTVRLTPTSTQAADIVDVYRFFDATNGTQLLTSGGAERDAILGTRSDLHYEGVGFKAVVPAQANANGVAIYRFFDTSTGTHFMTASAAERDTLLGSRSDLVYEPSSTMVEHATAQAGDQAVYRFFDQNSGAHFFTASVDERASILSSRPDMTAEGIAFYAPT